jgi:trehalose 6-phosphate phosphatase
MRDMTESEKIALLAKTPRLLVALDFDGTLAEMTTDPMQARMAPAVRETLVELGRAPSTTVGIISGRSLDDLRVVAELARRT